MHAVYVNMKLQSEISCCMSERIVDITIIVALSSSRNYTMTQVWVCMGPNLKILIVLLQRIVIFCKNSLRSYKPYLTIQNKNNLKLLVKFSQHRSERDP